MPDVDSTVLILEITRRSKLEGTFAKRKAQKVSESKITTTKLPEKGHPVILSRRDVALKRDSSAKKTQVRISQVLKSCHVVAKGQL